MLMEEIKQRMKQAMIEQDTLTRDILRVAVGELQTEEARQGPLADDQVEKIIRKLAKSNQESLEAIGDDVGKSDLAKKLRLEIAVLEGILPRTLTAAEIAHALDPVADGIRGAAGDGPAMGVAMKFLKGEGAPVDGRAVSEAVKSIRS